MLPRMHLIEIHEMPWCPPLFRTGTTGILQVSSNWMPAYNSIVPQLANALKETDTENIVDLCAGSSGPWRRIIDPLQVQSELEHVTLTDLYPNTDAFADLQEDKGAVFQPYPQSVDVRDVPSVLAGFRTMFASFHHFQPEDARAILQNAVDNQRGIGIFEITKRNIGEIIFLALTSFLWAWMCIPFVRPFRPMYILFTYLIPIIPIVMLIDSVVSCLRTYTKEEMLAMAESVDGADSYEWHTGGNGTPLSVLYLIGIPKDV